MVKNKKNKQNKNKNGLNSKPKKTIGKKKRGSKALMINHHILDPHRQQHFARNAHASTPYTVLREKVSINTSTSASADTFFVICPFYSQGSVLQGPGGQTNILGFYGVSATAPLASTAIISNILGPTYLGSRVRIHRMAVSVSCTGTNNTTTAPDGICQLGTLRCPIDLAGYASWAALSGFIDSREEVIQSSNLSIQFQPRRVVSFPLDKVTYDNFSIYAPNPSSSNVYSGDDLAPIVIRFPQTVGIVGLAITLHVEWTAMFDNNAILQSTAKLHPVAPDDVWHRASAAAMQVGGAVASFVGNGVANMSEAFARESVAAIGGLAYRGVQGLARQSPLMITR